MSEIAKDIKNFVEYFGGVAQTLMDSSESKLTAKQIAVEGLMGKLRKSEMRAGFVNLKIIDSTGKEAPAFSDDGQEHEIDTHDVVKGGHGVSSKDQSLTQKAMDLYVTYKREALALKYPDGQLIFDLKKRPQEFIDDCITPLVRERVIPENFIEDALSDTQQLINNALKSNSAELKKLKTEKQEKLAKLQTDFMGGRGKLERASALGGKVDQLKKRMINKIGKENVLSLGNKAQFLGVAKDVGGAFLDAKKWIPKNGKIPSIENAKFFLDPASVLKMEPEDGEKKFGKEGWQHLQQNLTKVYGDGPTTQFVDTTDGDAQRVIIEEAKQMKLARKIQGYIAGVTGNDQLAKSIGDFLAKPTNPALRDAKFYTTEGVSFLIDNITNGIGIGKDSKEMHSLRKALEKRNDDEATRRIATATIEAIDTQFEQLVKNASKDQNAADAISGLYSRYVDADSVGDATAPDVDAKELVKLYSRGFSKSLSDASTELASIGANIASKFQGALNPESLDEAIEANPKQAFDSIEKAAIAAINSQLDALCEKLRNKKIISEIALRDIYPGQDAEAQAVEQMKKSDEEMKQFEKDLVLIDKAGLDVAQQRSIEVLIAKLEKDRQVLQLVNTIGSSLQSLGSGPTAIVGYAVDGVSDIVVGEVLGALKAAKLIMKLATNIKEALERHALLKKFRADLDNSKIAVSSLTSTIQGFVNNKEEQVKFRDLELALTFLQMAGEVVGAVPTPITIAIGKTASKVASAAQSVAKYRESKYDQKMLAAAWNKTLEAIQNPGNRKVGLEALRLNPTLGMHAIAWAGITKQPPDPIARMFMRSTGLDENTLAVSGTEDKVRQYLVTRLNEDRKLNDLDALEYDVSKLKVDWAPPLTLDYKCWAVLTTRASRDATPQLVVGGQEKKILECFKVIGAHKPLTEYAKITKPEDLAAPIADATNLCKALREYRPVHAQGPHDDMQNEVVGMLVLANKYEAELLRLRGMLLGIKQAYDDLNLVLNENALQKEVAEKLKLSDKELADWMLTEITFSNSMIAKAEECLEQHNSLKDDPGIAQQFKVVREQLDKLDKRTKNEEFQKLLVSNVEKFEQYLDGVSSAEALRKVTLDKQAVNDLQLDPGKLEEFCQFWVNAKQQLAENFEGNSEKITKALKEKSNTISQQRATCELISMRAFADLF